MPFNGKFIPGGIMYQFQKKVRFSEVDAAGVVFFTRAFEYFHMAYEDFMASLDLDLHQQFLSAGTALPFVHAEADYKKAMKLGEILAIGVTVTEIGTRSFSINYQITGPENKIRVSGSSKHVYVTSNFKSATLPGEIRSKLEALVEANI